MKKHLTLILFSIIFGICLVLPKTGLAQVCLEGSVSFHLSYGGIEIDVCAIVAYGKGEDNPPTLIQLTGDYSTAHPDLVDGYVIVLDLGNGAEESLRGLVEVGFISADCRFRHDLRDYPDACAGWVVNRDFPFCLGGVWGSSPPCWRWMMPTFTSKNWQVPAPNALYEDQGGNTPKNLAPCCLIDRILTIGDYIFFGLLIVAIIVILLAAWGFLTAAGEPDKVKKARNHLLYAVIGIAVAFLAKVGVKVIAAIVG